MAHDSLPSLRMPSNRGQGDLASGSLGATELEIMAARPHPSSAVELNLFTDSLDGKSDDRQYWSDEKNELRGLDYGTFCSKNDVCHVHLSAADLQILRL
ncbi:hypothetical protein N7474_009991 [Penicillium riverlandense]|uniref:uncharacterized protein n=1 Tax=Penicillium riverlandense TaxID=1903569 RepID=UPI00254972F6|nr:uncharacterized protein N7474_009991 [Penicillium riverlandense]KAJ5808722.1 hypothetical protein N7474_009991 [Penicillium riverlandense]